MAAEAVTYQEARDLALAFYKNKRDTMPLPLRDMPRKIVANQALSINDIIANIESGSDIGQWLVGEYAAGLGMAVLV